jgi:3-isopropylmalate/(R)-2-methylmalate dehydratase small subunit
MPNGITRCSAHRFEIDPCRKEMLITGRDEIALTLGREGAIAAFEVRHAAEVPCLAP